ncbi:hypothetical protein OH492_26425 [Vibrio chagasii]|nr:hypothetical protein [Vibrio chagasii]
MSVHLPMLVCAFALFLSLDNKITSHEYRGNKEYATGTRNEDVNHVKMPTTGWRPPRLKKRLIVGTVQPRHL